GQRGVIGLVGRRRVAYESARGELQGCRIGGRSNGGEGRAIETERPGAGAADTGDRDALQRAGINVAHPGIGDERGNGSRLRGGYGVARIDEGEGGRRSAHHWRIVYRGDGDVGRVGSDAERRLPAIGAGVDLGALLPGGRAGLVPRTEGNRVADGGVEIPGWLEVKAIRIAQQKRTIGRNDTHRVPAGAVVGRIEPAAIYRIDPSQRDAG